MMAEWRSLAAKSQTAQSQYHHYLIEFKRSDFINGMSRCVAAYCDLYVRARVVSSHMFTRKSYP
jgi:hypothetical protein